MNEYLEGRIRRYVEGSISLSRFYHWYMMWHCWSDGEGIVTNPDDDSRVTLVIYEFTSEPIVSDPCREEWLKKELMNVVNGEGRWQNTEE